MAREYEAYHSGVPVPGTNVKIPMKLLVVELNSFHFAILPMYEALLPSLFGGDTVTADYYLLPGFVDRAKYAVGPSVYPLNTPVLRFALPTKPLRSFFYRARIQRLVDRLKPDAVVFNTVEPPAFLEVFRRVNHPLKIGVVHNPKRAGIDYQHRRQGELIFCLHEYNYRLLEKDKPVDGYLSPFYKYRTVDVREKSDDRLEIAVQGVISFNRRDYPGLVDLGRQLIQRPLTSRVIFNILGDASLRDGPRLKQLVSQHGLKDLFRFHVDLPDSEFFNQLARSDYMMPLLHPNEHTYEGAAKVTMSYGHSGAYGIPLILHRRTARLWGVPDDACVAYDDMDEVVAFLVAHGRDSGDDMRRRYRALIDDKIAENHVFLRQLSQTHPALAARRSRRPDTS